MGDVQDLKTKLDSIRAEAMDCDMIANLAIEGDAGADRTKPPVITRASK